MAAAGPFRPTPRGRRVRRAMVGGAARWSCPGSPPLAGGAVAGGARPRGRHAAVQVSRSTATPRAGAGSCATAAGASHSPAVTVRGRQRRRSRWPTTPRRSAARLERRLARRPVPQRGQPRAARSFPSAPRGAVARDAGAGAACGPLGRDVLLAISDRARGCSSLRNGPRGLEGTMISNTGDYGHFAGQVRGRQLRAGALRRLVRLPADGRAPRRHAARRLPRRASDPDAVDRGAEHRVRRTSRRPPRSRRADTTAPFRFAFPDLDGRDGHRARPAVPRQGGAWWTSSGAGVRPATTPRRSWCGSTGSITRGGSRSSAWPTRSPAIRRWTRRQVRRYRDKFGIPFPLLLAGHQRHRGRGRDAAAAARLHVVPDDDLPRAGRPRAAGPRRVLRPGHRARSTEAD